MRGWQFRPRQFFEVHHAEDVFHGRLLGERLGDQRAAHQEAKKVAALCGVHGEGLEDSILDPISQVVREGVFLSTAPDTASTCSGRNSG